MKKAESISRNREIGKAGLNLEKVPWNRGRAVGQMHPLTTEQVRTIRFLLQADSNPRDLALFCTAIDTMLRASDLLSLLVSDVTNHEGNVKEEFNVRQRKTGVGTVVGISPETRDAIARWIAYADRLPQQPLFSGHRGGPNSALSDEPLSRCQYRKLVKKWVTAARLDPGDYSSHSLRRTKAAIIYEKTKNIEVVRELLGQKSIAATSAYLNVGKRQALDLAKTITF